MAQKRPQNRSNDRNRNRMGNKKRRVYDQSRDTRRMPSQNAENRRPNGGNVGYPGAVEFPTRRQNNSGQRNHEQRSPSRPNNAGRSNNSIEFPNRTAHRPQNGQNKSGDPAQGRSGKSPEITLHAIRAMLWEIAPAAGMLHGSKDSSRTDGFARRRRPCRILPVGSGKRNAG